MTLPIPALLATANPGFWLGRCCAARSEGTPCSETNRVPDLFFLLGTGEHGIGLGKRGYLRAELGEGTVNLMKTIKRTIDPLGLMNPGKVRPPHFPLIVLTRGW